jgi:hypothetical protein
MLNAERWLATGQKSTGSQMLILLAIKRAM